MKSRTFTPQSVRLIPWIFGNATVMAARVACLLQLPADLAIADITDPLGLGPEQTVPVPVPRSLLSPIRAFARQPLRFERNDGQTDSSVAFVSRGRGHTLFFANDEVVMVLHNSLLQGGESLDASSAAAPPSGAFGSMDKDQVALGGPESPGVLRMRLVGANPRPAVEGEASLRVTANYFIGNQPAHWRTNIPTFGKVLYREVYPGIDLVFYGNDGQLEYDFVVAPGADPNQIAMEWEGADGLRVDAGGDLVVKVGECEVHWQKPLVYQELNGKRLEVAGNYRLGTRYTHASTQGAQLQSLNFVSFTLAGHNPALPLVIDPRLVYSTYLGGSGNDDGRDLAVDGQGNVYVAGITTSLDFPTKPAIKPAAPGGGSDIFVAKFNTAGELLFSTYLGGSLSESELNAASRGIVMALTPTGDCYVAGGTTSTNFPTVIPLQASLRGKSDVFVTALKSDGSALLFSTYLGGSGWDHANGIAIGPGDDVFIVGGTESSNFPTTNAFQPRISVATGNEGYQEPDAFITRLEAGGKSIRYSTFYGWSGSTDRAWDVAVDAEGNAYVVLIPSADAGWKWVFTKISADGTSRHFERSWPEASSISLFPMGLRLALAPNGRMVLAGGHEAYDGVALPAVNEPNPWITSYAEVYIAVFDATDGTYISAVYLGGDGSDIVARLIVDPAGDILVAGVTSGRGLEPSGFPVTDPLESGPVPGPSSDVFVARFRSTDLSLISSTLLGGPGGDGGWPAIGMALDPAGNVWLAGSTSGQFPTVDAFQSQFGGGGSDAFLAKLSFGERLQITLSGQTLRISWPAQATNYVLETAASLPAVSWATVTNTPTVTTNERSVQLPLTGNAKLFRLRQP